MLFRSGPQGTEDRDAQRGFLQLPHGLQPVHISAREEDTSPHQVEAEAGHSGCRCNAQGYTRDAPPSELPCKAQAIRRHVFALYLHRKGCKSTIKPQRYQEVGWKGDLLPCYPAFTLEVYTSFTTLKTKPQQKNTFKF